MHDGVSCSWLMSQGHPFWDRSPPGPWWSSGRQRQQLAQLYASLTAGRSGETRGPFLPGPRSKHCLGESPTTIPFSGAAQGRHRSAHITPLDSGPSLAGFFASILGTSAAGKRQRTRLFADVRRPLLVAAPARESGKRLAFATPQSRALIITPPGKATPEPGTSRFRGPEVDFVRKRGPSFSGSGVSLTIFTAARTTGQPKELRPRQPSSSMEKSLGAELWL